ncbi:MAG: restriction endonuclease subunit S [Cyclobacteriaceae bacterium]
MKLGELIRTKINSLDPRRAPDEEFALCSISAYDEGIPEILKGKEIGSSKKVLLNGDVVISRIVPHIRRVWVVPNIEDKRVLGSGEWIVFNSEKVDSNYLRSFLLSDTFHRKFMQTVKGVGGSLLRADPKQTANIQIPLPPLSIQKKIAEVLDKADAIRKRSRQILAKYDQLAQSVFLEMFGDPVKNEKGWKLLSLSDFGSFKNGLNYNKDDEGVEIRCLGVSDFKSNYNISDIEQLSMIKLSDQPSKEYLLKDGDLVFVRSNGNKDLVGRCVSIYPGTYRVSFSGFCIRFRIEREGLLTTYLSQLFRNMNFKAQMLNGGRGANIQNINQKILSTLNLPVPSIALQNQFASIIEQIEKQKAQTRLELDRAEELYQSLLQRAFKGELEFVQETLETIS